MIEQGKYQQALDEVNSVTQSTSESRALATDLQNYIAAKKAYNNGNYDQALTNLNTVSSGSSAIKEAYQSLRIKITAAENQATRPPSFSCHFFSNECEDRGSY